MVVAFQFFRLHTLCRQVCCLLHAVLCWGSVPVRRSPFQLYGLPVSPLTHVFFASMPEAMVQAT